MASNDMWIQEAIRHPGALRAYVRRKYGARGFTEKGTIKVEILRRLAHRDDTIGRRARLALKLRSFAHKRRRRRRTRRVHRTQRRRRRR